MLARVMAKKRNPPKPAAVAQPFNNPFAQLAGRELPPQGAVEETREQDDSPALPSAADLSGKLVVRIERKGRGGKTATLLLGVVSEPEPLRSLARTLAKELGMGVRVEGAALVLGGDQRERLAQWLRKRGAAQVMIGN